MQDCTRIAFVPYVIDCTSSVDIDCGMHSIENVQRDCGWVVHLGKYSPVLVCSIQNQSWNPIKMGERMAQDACLVLYTPAVCSAIARGF